MIHVATGNQLDVVYDYVDGVKVIKGLSPRGGELIPLTDPQGLFDVLGVLLMECQASWKAAKQQAL